MAEKMITTDNVSKDYLKELLDSALMDTSIDGDGDLFVREGVKCFLFPSKKQSKIGLLAVFSFKKETGQLQRLQCVNQINAEYIIVRCYVRDNGALVFDYDMVISGGVTAKAFVMTVKRFCAIPRAALQEHGADLIE